jgi:hypothetical protein
MRWLLLTLSVALCCLPALAQDNDPRLVGYWPFEEASGLAVLDASNQGHNGEIMNDSRGVKRVPGRTGQALEFTAASDPAQRGQDGAVALKGMEQVDWSKGLTVELWAKPSKLDRAATYELVSNTKDDRGPGFRLMISWLSLNLRSGEGGAGTTWGAASEPSLVPLKVGEWLHLAGTYDGSVFRVYADGVLAKESDPNLKLPPGQPVIFLGSYSGGYAYGFNGVIDEVKLYNMARTPEQIMLDARLGR